MHIHIIAEPEGDASNLDADVTTCLYVYIYVAGAVRNDELGICGRNSLFGIFGKFIYRSNVPANFKLILHFFATICDGFRLPTYFIRDGHFVLNIYTK